MDASELTAEEATRHLRLAAEGIDRVFEALWRATRNLEAYNGDFVILLEDEVRLGASAQHQYTPVVQVWKTLATIIADIRELRNEHLVRKASCSHCENKQWCLCLTAPPDFASYYGRLSLAMASAEQQYLMDYQQAWEEQARIMVALDAQFRLTPLPPEPV